MAEKMSSSYNDSSIDQLLGCERIRMRPASILGSAGLDGARHGFTEIYGNALDEVSSGYGDSLDVVYYEDGSISVRDYGRGVPLGWNDKLKTWNWHIIYNELYGGGKYGKNQEELAAIRDWSTFNEKDFNYLYSVGLNGLGAAATQYTSRYFIVESYRDGKKTRMEFRRGMPVIDGNPVDVFRTQYDMESFVPDISDTDEPNGTYVKWKPDDEVFTDVNVGGDWLYEVCRDIAYVAGIDLHFTDKQSGRDEYVKAGDLSDLLRNKYNGGLLKNSDGEDTEIYTASDFGHGNITVEGKPYIWVCRVDAAIALAGKKNLRHCCYHNSVKMAGGSQYEGIQDAISMFFRERAKDRGIKLEPEDYNSVLAIAVSSYSNYASFRNQTKDGLDNGFIRDIVYKTILDKLNIEYGKGNEDILDAVERVVREAETRIEIREAAKLIRDAKKAVKSKVPSKFVTCHAYIKKNYSAVELWIVEGDSAMGAIKQARDASFQAIMPIRGKCLNVMKTTADKIVKNAVISDIFRLLGTGMDIGDSGLFDINASKVGKIIFATDADEDGFQIRVLLFLIFYKLAPEMLRRGMVYIAETPRFEIKLSDGTAVYARDDAQRDEIVSKNAGRVTAINRFKGLGEVDPAVLRETTIHPDTRNLVPLTLDFNDEPTRELIDALFGADKYRQRKAILTEALGGTVSELLEKNEMLMEEIDNSDIDDEVEYTQVG